MDPTPAPTSLKSPSSLTVPIRLHKSTAKRLRGLILKLNKKKLGRKVKADLVINKALDLLTDEHFEEIKLASYSGEDRLELEYQKFCEKNGAISKDQFLQWLLTSSKAAEQPVQANDSQQE